MHILNRRNFIASLGLGSGAYMLGSMLKPMLSEAAGEIPTVKRYIQYAWQDGVPQQFMPQSGSGGSLTMGQAFAPLNPIRDQIALWHGMYHPFNAGLHGNAWFFTCRSGLGGTSPGGPSFDRFLAKEIGTETPWDSIHLSLTGDVSNAANGPGIEWPAHADARQAYASVFGGGGASPSITGSVEEQLAKKRSLLDEVREDAQRLEARLAGPERAKLQQYLDSIREMEARMELLADLDTQGCAEPIEYAQETAAGGEHLPVDPVNFQALVDVGVNAMACGLTNVLSFPAYRGRYDFLGVPYGPGSSHIAGHGMFHGDDPAYHLPYANFHAETILGIYQRLAAIPEGDGTMADNTVIVVSNTAGHQHHNGSDRTWLMLIGGLGCFRTDSYITFPYLERSINDAFITIAQALGVETDTFGQGTTEGNVGIHGKEFMQPIIKGPLPNVTT